MRASLCDPSPRVDAHGRARPVARPLARYATLRLRQSHRQFLSDVVSPET